MTRTSHRDVKEGSQHPLAQQLLAGDRLRSVQQRKQGETFLGPTRALDDRRVAVPGEDVQRLERVLSVEKHTDNTRQMDSAVASAQITLIYTIIARHESLADTQRHTARITHR